MALSEEVKKSFKIQGFSEETFIKDYKIVDETLMEATRRTMKMLGY